VKNFTDRKKLKKAPIHDSHVGNKGGFRIGVGENKKKEERWREWWIGEGIEIILRKKFSEGETKEELAKQLRAIGGPLVRAGGEIEKKRKGALCRRGEKEKTLGLSKGLKTTSKAVKKAPNYRK